MEAHKNTVCSCRVYSRNVGALQQLSALWNTFNEQTICRGAALDHKKSREMLLFCRWDERICQMKNKGTSNTETLLYHDSNART